MMAVDNLHGGGGPPEMTFAGTSDTECNGMSVAIALVFVWLGLSGISFIEAPLKFRAPGFTRE